jgi:hypothetical protein
MALELQPGPLMSRPNIGKNSQVFPDRKISEPLFDFAKRVLDIVNSNV